jgi:hypothetical protein
VEILSSSGTQSPPSQIEVPASPEMNPLVQPEASSPLGFNLLLARQKSQS